MAVAMDMNFFQNPPKSLLLQGLLTECKPVEVKVDGKTNKVLNISLLVSEPVNKNGVEMSSMETHVLTVKNGETFGEYYACLGQVVAIPVSIWNQDGRYGFWIPNSSRLIRKFKVDAPAPVSTPCQPQAAPAPAQSAIKSPLDK